MSASSHRTVADGLARRSARGRGRTCVRPGCPAAAQATLTFSYRQRTAWIGPLTDEPDRDEYDLCGAHAQRTRPPHGWSLEDHRCDAVSDGRPVPAPVGATAIGPSETVAVLAAALRGGRTSTPGADPQPVPAPAQARLFTVGGAPTAELPARVW